MMCDPTEDIFVETAIYAISSDSSSSSSTTDTSTSDDDDDDQPRVDRVRIQNFVQQVVAAYSDKEFRSHFRISRESCDLIEELVADNFSGYKAGRENITAHEGVLILLWYLSNQETFRQISDRFDITTSSAHAVIYKVVDLLVEKSGEYIKWPRRDSYSKISAAFFNRRKLTNVIGAIDGSHITINRPKVNQTDYCNRKSYHSLILQGVVDHRKLFMDVYAGEPGSLHDARVLRKSGIVSKANEEEDLFGDYFILGDSAYPCLSWLISPFRDNGHLTQEQKDFNYIHSSTRIIVENAFGLLKGRFRRLKKFDNINKPFIVKSIVVACMLHNICILNDDLGADFEEVDEGLDVNFISLRDRSISGTNRRLNLLNSVFGRNNQ